MAEPSLQLRLTQKLALSPQLQQAIRLLQLNRIELREYIQEVLDANPILEREEGEAAPDAGEAAADSDETQPESVEAESLDSLEDWELEGFGNEQWTEGASYDPFDGEFVAHEMTHNWWGNLISCTESEFLIEAFPTYTQALWRERTQGEQAFRKCMKGQAQSVLMASTGPGKERLYRLTPSSR